MIAQSPLHILLKLATVAPDVLTNTIANASSWSQFNIPNFQNILKEYNIKNYIKIDEFILNIDVKSSKDVQITSINVIPVAGTGSEAQVLADLFDMNQKIKENVPKYFIKNYETLNNVSPGRYTSVYKIPVPEATGIAQPQK